jgi:phage terminase large subunit-like protein
MSANSQSSQPPKVTSAPDRTTDYARRVVAGEIIAGPLVRKACQRHLDDLENGEDRGLRFDLSKAQRAIGFFADVLKLNGGDFEGVPFVLSDWQAFIVGSLFGWIGPDGYRRFRVAYIEIGKGNGKSPLAAGIGLYMLCADGEARSEVYAAATKKDQAMILFRDAVAMVDQSPELARRLTKTPKVSERCWNLSHLDSGSWFRAIGSDQDSQSGPRPHCGLLDEVHEHKSAVMVDMLRAGTKGRKQALMLEITNSGVDKTSVCYQHHEMSVRVLEGTEKNETWFAFVAGLDEDDDPFEDESCWIKANPNLGVSIQEKYIREQVAEAKGMPSKESTVRRLNFCQWVDADDPWVESHLWTACEDETVIPAESWAGREGVGALDLSGTGDLTALAVAFKRDDGGVDAFVEFWTPKDTLYERAKNDRVPYDVWERTGKIHATPGRSVDYSFVAGRIAELQVVYGLRRIAFDPYRIKYLERELAAIGVEVELIPHGQGFYRSQGSLLWMPRSIELAEKLIGENKLSVAFNPCLRWNVASAVIEADAKNNRAFTKRKAKGRIDGAVALTMAIGLLNEEPVDTSSIYETRGITTI